VLLTRDGTPLDAVASASNVIGTVGHASGALAARIAAAGFPPSTPVGLDGLELLFQRQLGGVPGGELFAGRRLLARTAPIAGIDVRTSISPTLQALAVSELGASLGGIVAMEPGNGELLAAAGTPLSELQPPGSTFKIITLTAVLEAHIATAATVFPYATSTTIDSFVLHNSDGEDCGGTLANAFAVSCNSVFAPLGVRVGALRLTAAAEAYGFNAPSPVGIAAQSSLPAGASIGGDLAVGSTAIGQARVLASPLQMLRVAGTIALVGRLPTPTFALVPRRRFPRVVPVGVARTIRALMRDVVVYGTGTAAQIAGVAVAGKTGTAQVATPSCGPTGASGTTGTSGAKGTTGASTPVGTTGASGTSATGATTGASGTTGTGATTGATGASAPNGTGGAGAAAIARAASGTTGATGATGCPTIDNNPHDTDAWFVAFAPEIHPRIVVAVLLPNDGAGGTTAAPLARAILEEGLALTR
jgi:cell division protein FtsI/penicillin-binding protein 2